MISINLEKELFQEGYKVIAGFDEAGRGALAGPIVSACVLLKKDDLEKNKELILEVNDSKKLSAKKREELFLKIKENFQGNFGIASNEVIDKIGIQKANVKIVEKASQKFADKIDIALLDHIGGFQNYYQGKLKYQNIIKGDAKHFVIALASIMAKVYRDKLMIDFSKKYPNYGFEKHKGYGTKLHLDNLKEFKASEIHRFSYAPVKKYS